MKEKFYQWMIDREHKKENTAYSYTNSIDKISRHYSEKTGKKINIFFQSDIALLESISHEYSKNGKFSSFGNEGKGTIRNAIATYVRFMKDSKGTSPFQNSTIDSISNEIDEFQNDDVDEEELEEVAFAYERDLQKSLINQVNQLFPDYKIYGNHKEGIEYTIESKRIDLLLENKKDHSLLAIELKSGLADSRVFGQISSYLGLLMKAFPDRKISGLIIAGEIDDSLQNACSITNLVDLKTYKMSISLIDVNKQA